MKLIKKASGKTTIKISKEEWLNIGEKAGWLKEAGYIGDLWSKLNGAYRHGLDNVTQDHHGIVDDIVKKILAYPKLAQKAKEFSFSYAKIYGLDNLEAVITRAFPSFANMSDENKFIVSTLVAKKFEAIKRRDERSNNSVINNMSRQLWRLNNKE